MDKQKDIEEKVQEGKIHSRIILEVAGKPKENVEDTLKDLVDVATKSESFGVITYEVFEAKEIEGMWNSFAELELLSTFDELVGFCFDFTPASIEIIEPEVLEIKSQRLTHTFNDLLGKIHVINQSAKELEFKNKNLGRSMTSLVKNNIVIALSGRKMKKEELAKFLGTEVSSLDKFLDALLKEEKIKEVDGCYSLK